MITINAFDILIDYDLIIPTGINGLKICLPEIFLIGQNISK